MKPYWWQKAKNFASMEGKEPLDEGERGEWKKKSVLNLNIQTPITFWQIDGETMETVKDFILLGSKITVGGDCRHEIKRHLVHWGKGMANLDNVLKSRDITLLIKVYLAKAMFITTGVSSSNLWMWELDHKEGWAPENWCFWTVVLEKTLQSSLDCKKIQRVHSKGDQPWKVMGKTCWNWNSNTLATYAKSWFIWKDPDAGKDWMWEEKGTTEDEMVGWHHQLDAHEFEQSLGVGDGQGSLVCCSPWGHKKSDTTERLNWTD